MKTRSFLLIITLSIATFAGAQNKYISKSGRIEFASPSNDHVQAVTRSANCMIDTKTGEVSIRVLVKGFEFESAAMQEKFNASVIESDKFPMIEFKGRITDLTKINFLKPGKYNGQVKGTMTLHGVTRELETGFTILVEGQSLSSSATFGIKLSHYKISNPIDDENINISMTCKLDTIQ